MKEFEVRMQQICAESDGELHSSAVAVMDLLFANRTKAMIWRSSIPDKVLAAIITGSVREIEGGSMETMDSLVNKKISAWNCP